MIFTDQSCDMNSLARTLSNVYGSFLLLAHLWTAWAEAPYAAYTPYLNVSNVPAAVQNASREYGLGESVASAA